MSQRGSTVVEANRLTGVCNLKIERKMLCIAVNEEDW